MANILLLNGPNLNLLGTREPDTYGTDTLSHIEQQLAKQAQQAGHRLVAFQSNSEAHLIEQIHQAANKNIEWIILNPAAFTHTSVALRDALLGVAIPFIEIHLSNVYAREAFRHHSYFSDIASGVIVGFGSKGYHLALNAIIEQLKS